MEFNVLLYLDNKKRNINKDTQIPSQGKPFINWRAVHLVISWHQVLIFTT